MVRPVFLPRLMLALFATGLAVLLWAGGPVSIAQADETGLSIATEARERQKGFGNFTAEMTMILRNKRGQESQRELRLKVIEVRGDGDRSMFVFDRPNDVKGTAFLVHAHRDKPNEQWLYLPAVKRVKRISSSNQSGSFIGSEFSYEDLGSSEVEKFTHTFLRNESCGNLQCSVLERVPAGGDSGYTRQLVWIDTQEFRTVQTQFFDRRNAHLKTLVAEGFNEYLGRFWHASKLTMTNHLTGKSTVLNWSNYEFGTDLDLNDFTRTGLKRAR